MPGAADYSREVGISTGRPLTSAHVNADVSCIPHSRLRAHAADGLHSLNCDRAIPRGDIPLMVESAGGGKRVPGELSERQHRGACLPRAIHGDNRAWARFSWKRAAPAAPDTGTPAQAARHEGRITLDVLRILACLGLDQDRQRQHSSTIPRTVA